MKFIANFGRKEKDEDTRRVVTTTGAWVSEGRSRDNIDSYVSKGEMDRLNRLESEFNDREREALAAMFD